ncbi:putative MPP superfamily phosphohydrolase [Paenibacillus forsythiae]|uniref:MPP superfamily phosphohydrolase n=1 Tax=Paenibacillus forsythiae TaxID=365616 RepID=A0ABU3H1X3_9BACL|nr:metallophosphoesterase [Paenibacillus forsythiae]MDT3424818.1 putative MPP superfamily phosphohydrolase [Paenibacillus forsythiae]
MKRIRLFLSIAGGLLLLGLVNFYIGYHLWLLVRNWLPGTSPGVFWPVFWVVALAYLICRAPMPEALKPLARFLKVIGSYYLALMQFAIILLPVADLFYWILYLADADVSGYISEAGAVIVALLAVFLVWGSRNAWSTVLRVHSLGLPKQFERNLKIAVASDIHLGDIVGNRHLKKMVDRMNAMQPDIVLLAGDVLDDSVEPFVRHRMSEQLGKLKARYGVFAVLGNHEYYGKDIKKYTDLMSEVGIRVLQDEVAEVAGVYIVGRKDKAAESMDSEGRMSVASLLEGLDLTRPVIMMDHQPTGFDAAARAGVDVLLSGHTHRGQIAPIHWITRRLFELDWGYLNKENLHVIVSSGYGTWGPPIRLASRSEIIGLSLSTN